MMIWTRGSPITQIELALIIIIILTPQEVLVPRPVGYELALIINEKEKKDLLRVVRLSNRKP
jgi:hypothetical protein